MNMRPLESEAESELHWRIEDERVKSSLKFYKLSDLCKNSKNLD